MEKEIIGYFCDECGDYCGNEIDGFNGRAEDETDYCVSCYNVYYYNKEHDD